MITKSKKPRELPQPYKMTEELNAAIPTAGYFLSILNGYYLSNKECRRLAKWLVKVANYLESR